MSKEVELKDVKENEQDEKETDLDADESTPMVSYGELVRYNTNYMYSQDSIITNHFSTPVQT